jgi:hypothetical protein
MKTRYNLVILLSLLGLLALIPTAEAAPLDFNEALSGDLSNFGSAPTPLIFDLGVNRVTGTMGGPPDNDPDIYSFVILPGLQLTSIFLSPMEPRENSFFALASGSIISMTSSETHLTAHLTRGIGELMPDLAAGGELGGLGFTAPLGAGTYTAWFQETTNVRVDYTMAYTVAAIPEPAAAASLLGLGVLTLALSSRRFRSTARASRRSS